MKIAALIALAVAAGGAVALLGHPEEPNMTTLASQRAPAVVPPIDQAAPKAIETATFALG
jgi:hypothetical protein